MIIFIHRDINKHFDYFTQAGILDSYLTLALEPEAASIYCQRVPLEQMLSGRNETLKLPGKQYIVADIGGKII